MIAPLAFEDMTPARQRVERVKAQREKNYAKWRANPELFLRKIIQWSRDPILFINDCGWVPDESKRLGGGMVPFRLYPRQIELVTHYWESISFVDPDTHEPDEQHLIGLKSRQVGWTAGTLWFVIWAWLFVPGCNCMLLSYEDDVIDMGGSNDRDGDSLFGKIRKYIDQLMWLLPELAFNQGSQKQQRKRAKGEDDPTGMFEGEDVKFKMVRPAWTVFSHELFPEAKRNTIIGKIPSDRAGKSMTYLFTIMDEVGDYREQNDWKAYKAISPMCQHIFMFGTIPEKAGQSSLLYDFYERSESSIRRRFHMHWTEIPSNIFKAYWVCSKCNGKDKWVKRKDDEQGGFYRKCECGEINRLTFRSIRSPWFDKQCEKMSDDIAVARYLQMDWHASTENKAFWMFDVGKAVCPRKHTRGWIAVQGFDPGISEKNPAAWVMARFCERDLTLRIVGYEMESNVEILKFAPFFKRWSKRQLKDMRIMYGTDAGKWYMDAFRYSEEQLEQLERLSKWPANSSDRIGGDWYGKGRHAGAESAYSLLSRAAGVDVQTSKVNDKRDKFKLIQAGRDWCKRLEVDPAIANYQPRGPHGGRRYPSVSTCFSTAQMVETEGASEATRDIHHNEPWMVSHPIHAYLYLCRELPKPENVHVRMEPDGVFVVEPDAEPMMVEFGDDSEFWPDYS